MSPFPTILHPTDFSDRCDHARRLSCALALEHGARLIVLHVISAAGTAREEAIQRLQHFPVIGTGIRAEWLLRQGSPAEEILRVAEVINAGLIVMGTHGWTGASRTLMGTVADQVVRGAPCAVLTVRAPFPAVASIGACRTEESVAV